MKCEATAGICVLMVDDNQEYLDAVSRLLATCPCVADVHQAFSGQEALAQLDALQPDLVLMDIAMPGANGLDVTRAIKARPDPPRVLIVTLYDTLAYRRAAEAAGADGFLGKSDLGARLQATIGLLFADVCVPAGTGRPARAELNGGE